MRKTFLSMWVVTTILLYRIKSVLSSSLCKVSPVSSCSHRAVVIVLPLLNLYGCVLQNSYSFLRKRRCQTFFIWSVWVFVFGFFWSFSCSLCMIMSLVLDTSLKSAHPLSLPTTVSSLSSFSNALTDAVSLKMCILEIQILWFGYITQSFPE